MRNRLVLAGIGVAGLLTAVVIQGSSAIAGTGPNRDNTDCLRTVCATPAFECAIPGDDAQPVPGRVNDAQPVPGNVKDAQPVPGSVKAPNKDARPATDAGDAVDATPGGAGDPSAELTK